jgi:hypothetical protein
MGLSVVPSYQRRTQGTGSQQKDADNNHWYKPLPFNFAHRQSSSSLET